MTHICESTLKHLSQFSPIFIHIFQKIEKQLSITKKRLTKKKQNI